MATVLTTHRVVVIPAAAEFYYNQAGALQTFHNTFSSWTVVLVDTIQYDDPNFGTVSALKHDIFLSSAQDTSLQGTFAALAAQLSALGLPAMQTYVDPAQGNYAF